MWKISAVIVLAAFYIYYTRDNFDPVAAMWKASVVLVVAAVYMYYTRDTFNPDDLVNKNVVVTGSSKGIGRALALQYARLGANVMVTARSENALKEVVSECRKIGRDGARFGYVVADMQLFEQATEKLIKETLRNLESIDHVVLNHALLPETSENMKWVGSKDQTQFLEKSMDINFMSYVHVAGAVIPHLKKSHGRMGVISSLAGKVPLFGEGAYCASKFAVDGFFSTLRLEMKSLETPVPVTICNLGWIETDDYKTRLANRAKALGIDVDTFKAQRPAAASVTDTAMEIIKATTRGDRELFYPFHMYGINTWFVPILRHVIPSFVESNPELSKK